jgi:hypothetical protein
MQNKQNKQNNQRAQKLSPEFSARLARLGPQQRIRAIVVLRIPETGTSSGQRQSRHERRVQIEAIGKSTEKILPEIDRLLARHEGKRLAPKVDALGCVPVETTPAGIAALADSEHVQSIFEDQAISLLS